MTNRIKALQDALTLAANRLQRIALDLDPGSRRFFEVVEWVDSAHAALAASQPAPEVRPGAPITLTYTNWKGETAERTIIPRRVWWGSTEWHPEPQWLLTAFDVDKEAERDFALKDFGKPVTVQDAALVPDDFQALLAEAMAEANRAMIKFPQPNYVISKFAEESGEVVKAAIHHAEGRETRDAVVVEIRQTLAMMLRLWIEGDQVHGMAPLRAIAEGRA